MAWIILGNCYFTTTERFFTAVLPMLLPRVVEPIPQQANINNAFLNHWGFCRQTIMLIEKFILPLKEPAKILRIIKELCSAQPVTASASSDSRNVASPEAWSHKELRTNFREQPPVTGPTAFPTDS
jgi:hypothetical protein